MMKNTYDDVRDDFDYLAQNGLPEDMCCVQCDRRAYVDVLTQRMSLKKALIQLIRAYFTFGYEDSPRTRENNEWLRTDPRCNEIRKRYTYLKYPGDLAHYFEE